MTTVSTMKAVVLHAPGGPEALKIEDQPIPVPRPGEVLIRVKAFGVNRSELFTRQGHSPGGALFRGLRLKQGERLFETRPAERSL